MSCFMFYAMLPAAAYVRFFAARRRVFAGLMMRRARAMLSDATLSAYAFAFADAGALHGAPMRCHKGAKTASRLYVCCQMLLR